MALDTSLKMGLVDISIMHILRKKKQSPKRTAKKIIDTFQNIYPDHKPLSEDDPAFQKLTTLVNENDFYGIRTLLSTLISK